MVTFFVVTSSCIAAIVLGAATVIAMTVEVASTRRKRRVAHD